MKRFFCTVCGRVKRVRKYPTNVVSVHADDVFARRGSCDKHANVLTFESAVERKRELFNKALQQTKRGA